MANIKLDIPDTRVVVRQPSVIVDRSKLPIQSVAEFALTASYANYAKNVDTVNIGIVGDISASGTISASSLYVSQSLVVGNSITAASFTGSFTGLITSASFAQVALTVLQDSFTGLFTGSFTGNGSDLHFTTLNTSQSANSTLVIGNIVNNYQYTQTTIFKNSNIISSGSITITPDGILVLQPRTTPNTVTLGGVFFSSSGEFYVGM